MMKRNFRNSLEDIEVFIPNGPEICLGEFDPVKRCFKSGEMYDNRLTVRFHGAGERGK